MQPQTYQPPLSLPVQARLLSRREKYQELNNCSRFQPVTPIKQNQWLTYYPRRCVQRKVPAVTPFGSIPRPYYMTQTSTKSVASRPKIPLAASQYGSMLLSVQDGLSEQSVFLVVPFHTVDLLSLIRGEFDVEFWSEEVNNRKLDRADRVCRRYDTVQ
jgi:hypothetical protein